MNAKDVEEEAKCGLRFFSGKTKCKLSDCTMSEIRTAGSAVVGSGICIKNAEIFSVEAKPLLEEPLHQRELETE